jgi:hypothetical protein
MDPQLVHAVQLIAQSLQPHPWPPTLGDILQVLLVLLTGGTLWLLRRYTNATTGLLRATRDQVEINNQVLAETIQLRRATQDQVSVSNQLVRETQNQAEQSLMPIVVLTTTVADNVSVFVVKNTGGGPALNTRTSPVNLDPKQTLDLHHRTVIGAGEQEEASFHDSSSSGPLRPPDVVRLLKYQGAPSEVQAFIRYEGANGNGYQTSHTLTLTSDKKDLSIVFNEFQKTGHPDSALRGDQ